MENFLTVYNEEKIFGAYNAWDYYFEPINKIKLRQVIKENFVFSKISELKSL